MAEHSLYRWGDASGVRTADFRTFVGCAMRTASRSDVDNFNGMRAHIVTLYKLIFVRTGAL